ncbi:hypothetical protein CIP107546_01389 [Corynebacterium diphtheriae]|uniref:hypothetical protein n=1 Tax=Corynebacterium diphtheriae TaxID=1717 RepID=UPI00092824FE|nr:hypothetical protein [Corynebacterium diphtheriae]OWN40930.1 hypothetical protein AY488_06625 [Corynebacterium belfantii]MBG9342576.1 hypothetical protein [Corynebacterium diphtheriae]OJH97722.1 hypothetical protein BKD78_03070 [Corynebacterium diphtheriae]OWN01736.1 hypothetical protein AY473_05470 [Corynebacterium diphtheriae bv. mitis]OWN27160.1 hypothetical protein AY486_00110 [Corynebacterium diphtheriae bv. mitis]
MIISTDLQLLISPMQWDQVASEIAQQLSAVGYNVTDIRAEVIDLTCEPDNMLVNQWQQEHGTIPTSEQLHRVVITGEFDGELRKATECVVRQLPEGSYWYGTSLVGEIEPSVTAACSWQADV